MSKQRLPSPPASVSGEYQHSIDSLLQHNEATPHGSAQYSPEDNGFINSGQSTTQGSPAGGHWLHDRYGNKQQHHTYFDHDDGRFGGDYVSEERRELYVDTDRTDTSEELVS